MHVYTSSSTPRALKLKRLHGIRSAVLRLKLSPPLPSTQQAKSGIYIKPPCYPIRTIPTYPLNTILPGYPYSTTNVFTPTPSPPHSPPPQTSPPPAPPPHPPRSTPPPPSTPSSSKTTLPPLLPSSPHRASQPSTSPPAPSAPEPRSSPQDSIAAPRK